jgi:hypothetical protein
VSCEEFKFLAPIITGWLSIRSCLGSPLSLILTRLGRRICGLWRKELGHLEIADTYFFRTDQTKIVPFQSSQQKPALDNSETFVYVTFKLQTPQAIPRCASVEAALINNSISTHPSIHPLIPSRTRKDDHRRRIRYEKFQ